ncbi:erythromycin esterase-like protein [Saccharopolyspora lacisalsi]|uniref:Erythromycin esterase-like protein n=1 Tax=Halosaccharopolyspora lacisalsi TaxID=1000566 RepID=A0A839DR43_9PSEU|nr:erythromycin esterase family protein [Halosaccharopolyspora lacisalsi]MBA8824452.1 erythromycin esterase-like protein [Halosaccharopolyspora lacisalsi]
MSTNSVRDLAVPLRTLDPADPDVGDLASIRDLVGDARLVCLGESEHAVSEISRLTDRVTRFLVDELGFSAFVMESGFAEGLAVDDWLRGGPGDPEQLARSGITYGFGACEEKHDQLRWMRDRNAEHAGTVSFYGMDAPGSYASPLPAVRACLARLEPRSEDPDLLALADLGDMFRAPARHQTMEPDERRRLSRGIADLVERARSSEDDIAYRCALGAQCLDDHLVTGRNSRDVLMADTVRWILDREERVVVSGHNGHVQRGSTPIGTPSLGELLAPALGEDMVVIGTTRTRGSFPEPHFEGSPPRLSSISSEEIPPPPPRSLDALMDTAELPLHLVDLRRVPPERLTETTVVCAQNLTLDIDPRRAFDALVHVRHLTPSPEVLHTLRDSAAREH